MFGQVSVAVRSERVPARAVNVFERRNLHFLRKCCRLHCYGQSIIILITFPVTSQVKIG